VRKDFPVAGNVHRIGRIVRAGFVSATASSTFGLVLAFVPAHKIPFPGFVVAALIATN